MTGTADDKNEEDRMMAAEYVLGLLAPAQVSVVENSLSTNAALRADVADWTEQFSSLTDDMPEVTPPPRVWTAVTARVFPEEKGSWWRRLGVPQMLGGAAVAAMLLWVAVSFDLLRPELPLQTEVVAEIGWVDTPVHFRAQFDEAAAALRVDRLNGTAAAGRALELWLIAGDAAPVSLVVWPGDADSVELSLPAELAEVLPGGVLAVSDEPEGGSPTGAPTGDVLATGVAERL